MKRDKSNKAVNSVLFLIVLFLFTGLSGFICGVEKQSAGTGQLREDILAAYKSGGEKGLLEFVKKKKDKITGKFIVEFAKAGKKERKEEWLNVCKIMAVEKKDEKTLADVLYFTGKYSRFTSNFQKTMDSFDTALSIYRKLNDPTGQGNVYFSKAKIYLYTGERSKALEMFDKASLFYEKAGRPSARGDVCLNKGRTYLVSGQISKALETFDQALVFYEKAGFPHGRGVVYGNKGAVYARIGENSKALEMFNKALPVFVKTGNVRNQGDLYFSMGKTYVKTGDQSKALEMFDNALPLYKKAGHTSGLGNVYKEKGVIYLRVSENSKAFRMLNKALPFFKKAGHLAGQGNVYLYKGIIYLFTGENIKALEMYDKAQPFFEKARAPVGQGNVLFCKGEVYAGLGDYSNALEMYGKALPFFAKGGDDFGRGNVYRSMGAVNLKIGENVQALEACDKALVFFKKVGDPIGQGNVNLCRGDIYSSDNKNVKAIEMYDKALVFSKKAGVIEPQSWALYGKAKVLVKMGKKGEALELFEKGINIQEKVRKQTAFSEMKRTLMEKVFKHYEDTVLFMLENKYHEKGFTYAESMRTRIFLDRMAEGWGNIDKGLPPRMKEKRDRLVANLSLLSKKIHKTAGKNNGKKLAGLKEQYRKTQRDFEDLLVKIRLGNPLYASVRYPQPITVEKMQKEVLKKGELLLRYFISPEKTYAFLVSRDSFKAVNLNIKEKEINDTIAIYLRAVKEKNLKHIKRCGSTLYRKLIKPLEPQITKNMELIVIPDGQLATIPFEALVTGRDKSGSPVFLLEKYPVKYVQSASLLSLLRKHYRRDSGRENFTGFGDPVYDYDNFAQGKSEHGTPAPSRQGNGEIKTVLCSRYARSGGMLNRLPRSGEEVRAIAGLFEKKSRECLVHLRDRAAEDQAKSAAMKDFDYIHFACHGLLNDDFQSLVLSQLPQDKSSEDGYLTLNEIMNCDFNAKLVVLSACQTGTGKFERAEGVTGLTRAVMHAGTPAVVASLWNVDDNATKELMIRFYTNMLEKNMSKPEALRQAKLELLKIRDYASPIHWSAFIMYGE